jgi:hypothetical protein
MKGDRYQRRFYRDWVAARDLYSMRVTVKETDLQILSDKPVDKDFIEARVNSYRRNIEDYIAKERRFLTSLKPIAVELDAPPIVKEMNRAAKSANVGPMAAVAGAIAQYLGKDILRQGPKEVLVENGGDVFLKIKKCRNIAIYAGSSSFSGRLCLRIKPEDTPLGIAASSGTIGHSLNFGNADAVVVLAKNALLADAVATATSNQVKSRRDFKKAIDFAKNIRGILGLVIIIKDNLASWGKIEFLKRG